jgi:hypothetical protein
MPDREISAREALRDIRSGMDEAELMEKYKLSQVGLKKLLKQLSDLGLLERDDEGKIRPPRKRIRVKEFLKDFHSGSTDEHLMGKYELTRDALDVVFQRLMDLKAIKPDELFGEPDITAPKISPINVREMERYCLDFDLAVYEAAHPGNKGTVRDITEQGVGVTGLSCSPGDRKVLVIKPDNSMNIQAFLFKAECCWNEVDVSTRSSLAGFKIEEISKEDLVRLKRLIGVLAI